MSVDRHPHDSIVAVATAPGRGAVGIVRASGQNLLPLIAAVCGQTLEARRATYLSFRDSQGEPIDRGLAIYFPAPNSYTGEDVLELQAHGGPVILQLLLARCLETAAASPDSVGMRRLRLAEPGEFTERAFLNDKLDLAQAEAVADLIDASTEAAARSASRSLSGAFSVEIDGLRDRLIRLRMLVEATLDFPEEEIDFLQKADANGQLTAIATSVGRVLDRARQGALLRDGIKIVLAGQPNVGKSSLLNALAGAELAIVTAVPGTTRDKVSETIQIEGVPVHVVDTAGLRDSDDEVERIGISRTWAAIEDADAILFMHDLTRCEEQGYRDKEASIRARFPVGARVIEVFNKSDAIGAEPILSSIGSGTPDMGQSVADALASLQVPALRLSAKTGAGLEDLRRRLLEAAGWQAHPEGVFIARARHIQALLHAQTHLAQARHQASSPQPALDLLAEDLRLAHTELGRITGAFSADDLLGEIFSKFCIGK